MSEIKVSIIAVGTELTSGILQDSNSKFLSEHLTNLGFKINLITLVEDDLEKITEQIKCNLEASDLVITTGGLGPTSDDITRDAVAAAASKGLYFDQSSYEKLQKYFLTKKREIAEINKRQCFFPEGSIVVPNNYGTADSFITFFDDKFVVSLPGIPREMKPIYKEEIAPYLLNRFENVERQGISIIRTFGLPESSIGEDIEKLSLDPDTNIAYRPIFPEVLLTVRNQCGDKGLSPAELFQKRQERSQMDAAKIITQLGSEYCFSDRVEDSFFDLVGAVLNERGLSVSFAESCTGGELSSQYVSKSGSSVYFKGSVVCYSNESKIKLLDVDPEVISKFGAVSSKCASQMAEGIRKKLSSDIGISITGIAGPSGGTEDKPVGTVYIGIATSSEVRVFMYFSPYERNMFRRYVAFKANDLLRRLLLDLELR